MIPIKCKSNENIIMMISNDDEEFEDMREAMLEDPLEFIGLALHSIQQWQAIELRINGYKVRAVLMDQTCGVVDEDDIFWVGYSTHPLQRLKDVILDNLQPV